jgi:hypothetical protein
MNAVTAVAAEHSRRHRLLNARVAAALAAAWADVDPADLTASWDAGAGQAATRAVTAAQALAAARATGYVEAALGAAGESVTVPFRIVPAAFAGFVADGRPVGAALYASIIGAKTATGLRRPDAMTVGRNTLVRIGVSEVQATARLADGAVIAATPHVTGYWRGVNLPSCGRCIILSGKWFARNAGFQRHPRCDCYHIPVAHPDAADIETPEKMFGKLSAAEQDAAFGKAGAAAVRAGADPGQIVNVTGRASGLARPGERFTTEGTTKRGLAGKQLAGGGYTRVSGERYRRARQGRLTPAAILDEFGGDPDRYTQALIANGYVIPRV